MTPEDELAGVSVKTQLPVIGGRADCVPQPFRKSNAASNAIRTTFFMSVASIKAPTILPPVSVHRQEIDGLLLIRRIYSPLTAKSKAAFIWTAVVLIYKTPSYAKVGSVFCCGNASGSSVQARQTTGCPVSCSPNEVLTMLAIRSAAPSTLPRCR